MAACYRKTHAGLSDIRAASGGMRQHPNPGSMKGVIWDEIRKKIEEHPKLSARLELFSGLLSDQLPIAMHEGKDFLYLDNAYFKRGARSRNFRMIRKGFHLQTLLDRPSDRRKALGAEPKEWRRNGSHIVLIPPSEHYVRILRCGDWLDATRSKLKRVSDRKVLVKADKKTSLPEAMSNAWAMVTYGSAAGVEAVLAGIPVFAGPLCPTLPISAGSLDMIERPNLVDPEPWLNSLAYASWSLDEIDRIEIADYAYDYKRVDGEAVAPKPVRWRDAL